MAGPDTLLGLDIGTTKVAAVIGDRSTSEVRIVGAASVPCQGLRRGSVVDVAETTQAIQEAVTKAQRMAGAELELAWVGVTGQHVSCLNSRGEVQLARANREITQTDVERVMSASVNSVSIPPDRQMIHAISRGFRVDDEARVRDPVGLSANRLGVDTHVVTASRNLIDNVVRCVEQARLGVAELVAEPLATADAVLSAEEQELGVLLMDIGGGTTDLALFADGSVAFTGAIPAAGNNVTHDLAVACGITHPQAEQIKVVHGCARVSDVPDEQMVQIPRDEEERTVSRRQIAQVIEARVQEIFRLVAQEMDRLGAKWPPPGGAVLTGGGSLLTAVARTGQETLGCRVRLGRPRVTSGPMHLLESPSLATGVGLVYYAHREAENRRAEPRPAVRLMPALGRLVAWVRDLFSS
jgi:cell division protein FtsA